ncbi:MAG: SGNH/GDSL hydrolase family protein [Thiohalocapsa sp.]
MKTILCYGDSNTWGMIPMTSLTSSERHARQDRWPAVMQRALGADYAIIEEGLNGRTTVFDDPIDGEHKNGRSYLLPCLESHAPLDLVIIMLGSNDLKSRFNLSAYDIASGAGRLAEMVSASIRGQRGIKPETLLVCPCCIGPLRLLAEPFAGGVEKSQRLHTHYRAVADSLGCNYLNAGDHAVSSPVDGLHFDAGQQRALGLAIADEVRGIFESKVAG